VAVVFVTTVSVLLH